MTLRFHPPTPKPKPCPDSRTEAARGFIRLKAIQLAQELGKPVHDALRRAVSR